ncbi:MAG: transglycosylase SLT domain-containing protein [Pseudomonadota bacterium]
MTDPASRALILPQSGFRVGAQQPERTEASRQISPAARARVEQAIANAAQSSSVDFDYLLAQAKVESALNPSARAPTSSASGLYQFIESTWLSTVKRHGERFGLGDIAAQIRTTSSGGAYVADPSQRAAILNLRNDPQIASLMAAGLAEDNRSALVPVLGRQPEASELYLAHFLGAGGAGRFLSAMQADPSQSAASLFRQPAAANRAVFYEPGGSARSLAGVMDHLGSKLARAMGDRDYAGYTPGDASGYALGPGAFGTGLARGYSGDGASAVPYLITAEEVFGPRQPVQVTGGARAPTPAPRIPTAATLPLPGTAPNAPAPVTLPVTLPATLPTTAMPVAPAQGSNARSMSNLLGATYEASGASALASPESAERIERAYERLRALGL